MLTLFYLKLIFSQIKIGAAAEGRGRLANFTTD